MKHIPRETEYHIVELSVVSDDTIEIALNKNISDGWIFDSIHFVVRDASRRPSMAFIFFVRLGGQNDNQEAE